MATKKQPLVEGFNPYQTIERLHTANLVIHTIPGEEWTLSCERHKTLLVDVYTLLGWRKGARKPVTYQCGLLGENLLRLMCHNRKVQYHHHTQPEDEKGNIRTYLPVQRPSDTLEEYIMIGLRGGDIIFRLIPEKCWRLTNTSFRGGTPWGIFYFADEETLGTPELRMFRGSKLEHVLLEFLCQDAEFVEKQVQSKVLTFAPKA